MNQAGYFETKQQFSPTTLAMIVALHAAAIGTAILWKIEVIRNGPVITRVITIPIPPDPQPVTDDSTRSRSDEIHQPYVRPIVETLGPTDDTISPPPLPLVDPPPLDPIRIGPPPLQQSARASGDVRTLITPNDYPEAARRNEETGAVRARLDIGANGNVTGCSIVASSGSTALDSATCRVLKARAHFMPAKDSSGQAVADSYVTPRIVWKIEGDG